MPLLFHSLLRVCEGTQAWEGEGGDIIPVQRTERNESLASVSPINCPIRDPKTLQKRTLSLCSVYFCRRSPPDSRQSQRKNLKHHRKKNVFFDTFTRFMSLRCLSFKTRLMYDDAVQYRVVQKLAYPPPVMSRHTVQYYSSTI